MIQLELAGGVQMKIAHLGDLHIGRKFNDFDIIEDQRYILNEIVNILKDESIDVLMISGDVYDKNNPSEQAFSLWNDFLNALDEIDIEVLVTSGNHDSQERLGFANSILSKNKIHIVAKYNGVLEKIQFEDEYGKINFYMMPFIKPSYVRNVHSEFTGRTHHEAVEKVLQTVDIDEEQRNILMAHQFVIGGNKEPLLSDSEIGPSVGGVDSVDASLFSKFDYVALGHIHRPQKILNEHIRYSGSPLKYSFSEWKDNKSMPVLDFTNELKLNFIPLKAKRDVCQIEGLINDLYEQGIEEESDDLIHAIIRDEGLVYNPISKLRAVYPNIISLDVKNSRTLEKDSLQRAENILELEKIDLISNFFKYQNGRELNEKEMDYLQDVMRRVEE